MEAPSTNMGAYIGSLGSSSGVSSSRRNGMQFSASNFIRAPLTALLEYSAGMLRVRSSDHDTSNLIPGSAGGSGFREHVVQNRHEESALTSDGGEVSIRIISACDNEHEMMGTGIPSSVAAPVDGAIGLGEVSLQQMAGMTLESQGDARNEHGSVDGASLPSNGVADGELADAAGAINRDSSYQRYDIQQAARWIEQVLPFSLLLLVVFIRQHLQGFFVTIWVAAVMFKSNDILRKQTALKGERKVPVLIVICLMFLLHVVGVYWWYHNDDLLYPLVMLPLKTIPPFWHAVFIVMANDILVRQAAMVLKCMLLMYYKNSKGRNYRKQGQLLTLIEYLLILYRALLPTPVWYRFFLNKECGSLFSSLMTGLYLTFKLTSVVAKVQSFFGALKALSRKEVHYGAYATLEQVSAAGDLCAICQEKMHVPIILCCKHIFCEDCVSEWFERERTCPLCRTLVKQSDLRSFGDGSTSMFFQLF